MASILPSSIRLAAKVQAHTGTQAVGVELPPRADWASFGRGFGIGLRLRFEDLVRDVGARRAHAEDPSPGAPKSARNPFPAGQKPVVFEHQHVVAKPPRQYPYSERTLEFYARQPASLTDSNRAFDGDMP